MALSNQSITDTDELLAVNDILAAIGESPVNTLEGSANVDIANAQRILRKVNRQIQSKGWTFNIEQSVNLEPNTSTGLIPFMDSYLSVMATSGASTYINRAGWLYDTANQTDVFGAAVQVNLIRLRNYYEMPECYRNWIVTKAARQFNNRFFGAQEVEAVLAQEEEEARMDCNTYENDYGGYNMLDGDSFVGGLLAR